MRARAPCIQVTIVAETILRIRSSEGTTCAYYRGCLYTKRAADVDRVGAGTAVERGKLVEQVRS